MEEALVSWHVLCLLGPAISVLVAVMILHRQPRLPPQWSKEQSSKWAGVGLSPRLQRGHKTLRVLVLMGEEKIYTRNDCFINSL